MNLFCVFRERKSDDEWKDLNKIKLPILLNYAQCKLINGDFYSVIEHCNTVLEYEPGVFIYNLPCAFNSKPLYVCYDMVERAGGTRRRSGDTNYLF